MSPEPLWSPSAERIASAGLTRFAKDRGLPEEYAELHRWSVEHLEEFWGAIWEEFAGGSAEDRVLGSREMPGAEWFPDVQVNYAERAFAGKPDEQAAIHHASESRALTTWTWGELRTESARIRAGLATLGVAKGDRVAALLPNIPETIAAFLATASLGAIWSSAAPEFGARSVIDRFAPLEPKVVLAIDGYRYGGRDFSCSEKVAELAAAIPSARMVRLGYLAETGWEAGFLGAEDAELTCTPVAFAHPLWTLFSSGTTGLPKAIMHGHGGMLVEQLKMDHLHLDCHPGDRVMWFTTTGWMMWNFLVGILLSDAAVVLYDGNPAGDVLWDLAAEAGVTTFGTSAAYVSAQMKAGAVPREGRDLTALRAVGCTGSPLSPEGFTWLYDQLGPDLWLFSTSGGTDVCTAFVGGVPTLPVYRGELQAPALGSALEAWSPEGEPLVGEVGELVITAPMPSMPVGFWNDEDGERYREAYFEMFPGVWRHGDWLELTERGTAIIHGRSDATINRGGIRMGTAELYRAVLAEPEVLDALVVDLPREDAENLMPLFVVLAEGSELTEELVTRIKRRVRSDCSPRHVPDEVTRIAEIPRTLSGKVLEIPVKRILMGADPEQAVSRESLANPGALDPFLARAKSG